MFDAKKVQALKRYTMFEILKTPFWIIHFGAKLKKVYGFDEKSLRNLVNFFLQKRFMKLQKKVYAFQN